MGIIVADKNTKKFLKTLNVLGVDLDSLIKLVDKEKKLQELEERISVIEKRMSNISTNQQNALKTSEELKELKNLGIEIEVIK